MAINLPIITKFSDKGIKDAETALGKFGRIAATTAAAATAAVTGIAVASVREFANFDAALNQSLAIMGDVSETMRGEMSDAAREVAKNTTFSAEQAAESFFFLASAGLSAEQAVAAMPQVAKFAQAGMFDMALATDLATDAQSALGLTSDDAAQNLENLTRVTDVFVKANTLANTSVEQLATAFTVKAGNALKTVGKDVEEGAAVLALFADQGIKGEQAGTLLTNTLFGLTDRARASSKQFEELGIEVFDAEGNMNNLADIAEDFTAALGTMTTEQQINTIAQLGFNKQARTGLLALIGNADAIREYEGALREAGGTVDEVSGKQLETFNAQMELLKSRVADVGIEIGGPLVTSLLGMTDELTPIIDELGPAFVEFFEALMPVIKGIITILPQVFAAAAPALRALSAILNDLVIPGFTALFGFIKDNVPTVATFVGVLGGLVAILKASAIATAVLTAAKAALNFVLALNPFVLLAIAIAAVIAGIVYLATRTRFFQDTWAAMTKHVSEGWEGFKRLFEAVGKAIGDFFKHIGNSLKLSWDRTIQDLKGAIEFFGQVFRNVWNGITSFFRGIVNGYIGFFEGFINGAINGINALLRAMNRLKINIPATPFTQAVSLGFNIPEIPRLAIPRLADGGIVMPTPGGTFANIAEAGKPEAVIPLDRFGDLGGKTVNYNVTVNAGMGADGNRIGEQIVNEILRFERSSGRVFARA
jgi:TP901 family phage tail tape measure protein